MSDSRHRNLLTVDNLFRSAARVYGDKTAVVFGEQSYTYGELSDIVTRLAAYLAANGIRPGDRVSTFLTNSPGLSLLMFACARLGAVFNPVNYRLSPAELLYILDDASTGALFYDRAGRDVVERIRDKIKAGLCVYVPNDGVRSLDLPDLAAAGGWSEPREAALTEDRDCLLIYTSGTTGQPKGVLHTGRSVVLTSMTWLLYNRIGPADRVTMLGAMYHIGPLLSIFLPAVQAGAAFYIPSNMDPEALWLNFRANGITTVWGVPTVLNNLASRPAQAGLNLRLIQYSGAPMAVAVLKKIRDAFGDVALVNAYGMTECDAVTALYAEEHDAHLGSIGKSVPNTEVRLVAMDGHDQDAVVAPGELGEVVVKSPVTMSGYYNRPGKTRAVLKDGWYFTGDVARRDRDGYLYLEGRADDLIISGGENVSPVEVENVLFKHPKVKEVSVAGVVDEVWGAIITAFVVRSDDEVTPAELDEFCRSSDELADYKRPRKYVFLDELPKTSSGKIDRKPLKAWKFSK